MAFPLTSLERAARRLHGLVDVSRLAARNLLKHLPVRRVQHIEGLPRQGGHGLVGDEVQLHVEIVMHERVLKITIGTQGLAGSIRQNASPVKVKSGLIPSD